MEFEYLGGPCDGDREDGPAAGRRPPAPGAYVGTDRRIVGADEVVRTVLAWTPDPDGIRNAPECREACSRGCPAYGTTP